MNKLFWKSVIFAVMSVAVMPLQAKTDLRDIKSSQAGALSAPPHLVAHLPQDAIAYFRVPNFFTLLGGEGKHAFNKAFTSQAYTNALTTLKEPLASELADLAENKDTLLQDVFIRYALSPLEIAVVPAMNPQSPLPAAVLHLKMNFNGIEQLNAFFTDAATRSDFLKVIAPFDAEGAGVVQLKGMPFFAYFDVKRQHFYLLSGLGSTQGDIQKMVAGLQKAKSHPMYDVEQQFDAGRQGLFVWADVQKVMSLMEKMGALPQLEMMRAQGLNEAKYLALGLGTVAGKYRAKFELNMPLVGMRSYMYAIDSAVDVKAAGEITMGGVVNIPSKENILKVESLLVSTMNEIEKKKYQGLHEKLQQELGFGVWDVFDAVGSQLVFVSDEAGEYAMLQLKDKKLFNQLLKALEKKGVKSRTKKINGEMYTHLILPSLVAGNLDEVERAPNAMTRFFELPSHLFWKEEKGYLVFANVPQVLMDRAYIKPTTSVEKWLREQQSVSAQHALALGSVRSENLPRMLYGFNLQLLMLMADLLDQPIDIFALPSAKEAALPTAGAYSFQVNSSASAVSLELSFEHNPMEILFAGGGYGAVAGMGILAAVAVPAYNDYTVRARVLSGIVESQSIKTAIHEFYITQGSMPSADDIAGIIPQSLPKGVESITYDDAENVIIITYDMSDLGEQRYVYLSGMLTEDDGGIQWSCYGDMEEKYLPKDCRE